MSLDRYRRPRLIVLGPNATAHEGACAMAEHQIGAVLVQDGEDLVGIVTDRDLALDVVGTNQSAAATTLHDVMSDELASVDVEATVDDVVRLMREHGCRRIPVLSEGKPVGLVSLDDLLLDGAIDLPTARAIVAAQIESVDRLESSSARPRELFPRGGLERRNRARIRREARAENTYGRLLHDVMRESRIGTRERAEQALHIVLAGLCRRLTPTSARHLLAQLPSKLAPMLEGSFEGPDKHVTLETIEVELRHALHLVPESAIEVLYSVCEAISDSVSAGEIEKIRAELPTPMKDLFPTLPFRRAG